MHCVTLLILIVYNVLIKLISITLQYIFFNYLKLGIWTKFPASNMRKPYLFFIYEKFNYSINPLKPEFTIVIFIHYKPWIAVAILDLLWIEMTWSGWQMKKNLPPLYQFQFKF